MQVLAKVEQLKNELDSLRPLETEAEARIMQKFRLDWNYHSNNIEGNSLTYGETKALILFGVTAQGKPLKDHFEITGHNEAINWILEIVKDERPLTETFIRELHTLLLKESSYKEALTPEGKPTRRKIEVGKYKTQPNHIITVTGETFYFATPEETPAKMQELIEWFRNEKEKPEVNPIILAALFHYRFIRIHPFDDGNGRVARILMNFILLQFGYPPVIIKTEDKENYYAVLRLADAGEVEPFIEYITENLIRSLEIMVKGAKGESVEEPNDLDKELALLERKFRTIGEKIEIPRSEKVLLNFLEKSVKQLIIEFIKTGEKFERFYSQNMFSAAINDSTIYQDKNFLELGHKSFLRKFADSNYFSLNYTFDALNQVGFENNSYFFSVRIEFSLTGYSIFLSTYSQRNLHKIEKLYSEQLNFEEITELMKIIFRDHMEYIKQKISDFVYKERNKDIES